MRIIGDSVSTESTLSGASTANNSWAGLISPLPVNVYISNPAEVFAGTITPINNAASGATAMSTSTTVQALTPDIEPVLMMIGTNDVKNYKNDVTKQGYYKDFLTASVVWLLTPVKQLARTGSFTYTGAWGNTQANTFGKCSAALGASVSGTFTGDALYVFYILQAIASPRKADILVDGAKVGEIDCAATGISGFAQACKRFSGFGAGTHTFELVTTTSGNYVYFNGIADSDQVGASKFLLSNIPYYSAAYNTSQSVSQATTDDFNALVDSVVTELDADGFNILKVDNNASIDPTSDLKPDGVHILDSGHAKIYANFLALL